MINKKLYANRRYNHILNSSEEQINQLNEFTSYARGLWNLLLYENMHYYQHSKELIFYNDMAKLIKKSK